MKANSGFRRRSAMPALLLISSLAAVPAFAQECETKIGAIGPLSGGAAAWGLAMKAGAEFVAAQANATGGVQVGNRKCKVTVLTYDTKYTADGAAAGANYLASQNVKLIIGPVGSPEATGIKPVANRNGQLTFNSSYAKDAVGPQWPTAFHQLAGPAAWAPALVKSAKDRFKISSVVVVAPNDQGGTDVASVNAEAYKANGIKTTEEYYQRGTTNFAPIVTRIMNVKPDAVDTASSPPGDGATMVKQLLEAGFTGVIGRLGGPGTPEIIRAAGGVEKIKGFYWLELVAIDDPKVKSMLADYQAVMKTPAPDNTLMFTSAAATRMVLKAITAAGTDSDAQKVADALRKLPPEDPYLGKGVWTGKANFGVDQELVFPVGMGLVVDGKHAGVTKLDLSGGK
jgi:branched-chain amino acid transport system substrate-binding protein